MMEKAVTSVAVPEVEEMAQKCALLAQRRDAEDLAHILKGDVRILVLDPHGLGGVDGGTAADGNDPVRLELLALQPRPS